MYHLGNAGTIQITRSSGTLKASRVDPEDVAVSLNRFSFDGAEYNIISGDRLVISTTDPRGLVWFQPGAWTSGQVEDSISTYVHVNEAGGLRCYETFSDAIANNRGVEFPLQAFTGGPIPVEVSVIDVSRNLLGDIVGYTFNTEREAIDTTVLSDRFRSQYNAGLLTGSGQIDCLFKHQLDCADGSYDREISLVLLQIIQRLDLGSQFTGYFVLVDPDINPDLDTGCFYQAQCVVTRAGVEVRSDQVIRCSVDFVTTGEFLLRLGRPADYILKEDDFRILLERDLGFLLQEVED